MKTSRSNSDDLISIPTNPKTFLGFIDILFGVLVAYLISEIPVAAFENQAVSNYIIFFVLYFATTAKMFLHWWSLHFDIPITTKYINRLVTFAHYGGALVACGWYIIIVKLVFQWFEYHGSYQWMLNMAFVLIIVFRAFDILANSVYLPKLIITGLNKKGGNEDKDTEFVKRWFTKESPKIFPIYFVHILLLVIAISFPKTTIIVIFLYLIAEIWIEVSLSKGRKKLLSVFYNFLK